MLKIGVGRGKKGDLEKLGGGERKIHKKPTRIKYRKMHTDITELFVEHNLYIPPPYEGLQGLGV